MKNFMGVLCLGNKNKTQAPNEKQRTAIMVLALIIVIAFLGAGIFALSTNLCQRKTALRRRVLPQ